MCDESKGAACPLELQAEMSGGEANQSLKEKLGLELKIQTIESCGAHEITTDHSLNEYLMSASVPDLCQAGEGGRDSLTKCSPCHL